jgi:LysM repeat protein
MALPPRVLLFTALAAAPALLISGCGEDETGSRTTLAEVQASSYVVRDPVTTTTTTTVPTVVDPDGGTVDPNEQTYTVQSGDSVFRIAGIHDIEPEMLANYNSWPEGISHNLLPGDIIKIPPGAKVPGTGDTETGDGSDATATDTEPDTADTTEAAAGVGCQHTVVAGDNPSRLAEQYEVTLDELNAVNADNAAYRRFLIGDLINIPANGTCP